MIAVQGPEARDKAEPLLPLELRASAMRLQPFFAAEGAGWFVGRTGYTGEDGFEIMLPAEEAAGLWRALLAAGVRPCGLGARDTLRLEAGMNLYGQDMDESVGPLESGLAWTVAWEPAEREFIGRAALTQLRDDPARRHFVGLLLTGRGVLRGHQKVLSNGVEMGEVTSGGFSPTLEGSIALARVAPGPAKPARWRSGASRSRHGWSSRPSCATAKSALIPDAAPRRMPATAIVSAREHITTPPGPSRTTTENT